MVMGSKLIRCGRSSLNLFGIACGRREEAVHVSLLPPSNLTTSLWSHKMLCLWWQTHVLCTDSRLVIYFENVQTQWVDRDTYLQIKLIDQYCGLNIINICVRLHSTRLLFIFFKYTAMSPTASSNKKMVLLRMQKNNNGNSYWQLLYLFLE